MARTLAKSITSTPVGSIMTMAKANVPTGYLACDGSIVSRTTYAALFAELGVIHGEGDGSTTFHLPDLRGRFLRGTDDGAGRDPDTGTRSAANAGGAVGDTVGSVQGSEVDSSSLSGSATSVGDHYHVSNVYHPLFSTGSYAGQASSGGTVQGGDSTVGAGGGHGHAVTLSGGGAETRSINANVKYAIKY